MSPTRPDPAAPAAPSAYTVRAQTPGVDLGSSPADDWMMGQLGFAG